MFRQLLLVLLVFGSTWGFQKTFACGSRYLSVTGAGLGISIVGHSQNIVDVEILLGNESSDFEGLIGFVLDFALPNSSFTDDTNIEVLVGNSWACEEGDYTTQLQIDRLENRLTIQFTRTNCSAVSGRGSALKLRLYNMRLRTRQSFLLQNPGGLVIEEIVNLINGDGLQQATYFEPLDSAFASHAPIGSNENLSQTILLEGNQREAGINEELPEIFTETDWQFFPNPSNGILNVISGSSKPSRLSIFDLNGKLVSEFSIDAFAHTQLALVHIKPGLYFLKWNQGASLRMQKLILQ